MLNKARSHWVFVAGALVISLALCASPFGRAWDLFFLDLAFVARGGEPPPEDIVIVGIDEASFGAIGETWPWSRRLHARLIDALFDAGAKAVVFDVIFAELSDPSDDRALQAALERHRNVALAVDRDVVTTRDFTQEILVGPPEKLIAPHTRLGLVNLPSDDDGFVRRLPVYGEGRQSLGAVGAELFAGSGCCEPPVAASRDRVAIDFLGPSRTVRSVSYYQALDPEKYLPAGTFEGKLVFVGVVTQSLAQPGTRSPDYFPTPFARWGTGYTAGVEIHATIAYNLIHGRHVRLVSGFTAFAAALALSLLLSVFFARLRPGPGFVLLLAALSGVAGGIVYLFIARGMYASFVFGTVPLTACYLVSPFTHYYTVLREKRHIQKAFTNYLAPTLLDEILQNPESLQLGGKEAEATVLFLDIAGFTTLSEKYTPRELIDIMNRFLNAITDIVLDNEGMVDKFIGDAVMAVWGTPVPRPDHAHRACQSALEVQQRINELAAREVEVSGAEIAARVGVNTGKVVAGNVGGERRFDYTVLGNTVNLSSRLEGVNKLYATKIMIGESTMTQAGDDFTTRLVDLVRVKGKTEPEKIFELQAMRDALDDDQRRCNAAYDQGFASYLDRRWKEAQQWFEKGLEAKPDDGPCRVLLERCAEYRQAPPGPDWDGVYDITTK